MITTNVTGGGNFVVTADDIHGPWSDPTWIAIDSIDPSLFWDDDGKCYITVNGTNIRQAEINPDTGEVLSELKPIWAGTGGRYPEGPHLFKRDGMYYLTIAEGGTEYAHMQTLARSSSPWGPFEPCPHNPILSHRSLLHDFQAIGHADFFDDPAGNWWAVCLGIRPTGYPSTHCLGRETFLVPVVWNEDGWPVLGEEGRVPLSIDLPAVSVEKSSRTYNLSDGKIGLEWFFLRHPIEQNYLLDGKTLTLTGSPDGLGSLGSPTWLGIPQSSHDSEFVVVCSATVDETSEAGLSVFQNDKHRVELYFQAQQVCLRVTVGDLSVVKSSVPVETTQGKLIVKTKPLAYEFYFDNGTEHLLGTVESKYLSTEVAGGFTGAMLGAYAYSESGDSKLTVSEIRYVKIEQKGS